MFDVHEIHVLLTASFQLSGSSMPMTIAGPIVPTGGHAKPAWPSIQSDRRATTREAGCLESPRTLAALHFRTE